MKIHRRRLDELMSSDSVPELDRVRYLGYSNLISYGKLFIPGDWMQSDNSQWHYDASDNIDSDSLKPLAIIVARDHAKTTLIRCSILRDFSYTEINMIRFAEDTEIPELKDYWITEAKKRQPYFYGWCSSTVKKSRENVDYVRKNLEENPLIIEMFGSLSPSGARTGKTWTKEIIVTSTNDKLESSSNLTSIRGGTHTDPVYGSIRFIKVFIDDAENEENTKTFAARDAFASTVMNAIYPAIDKKRGRLYFIGTPVHYSAFAQKLIDTEKKASRLETEEELTWKILVYSALQPDYPGGVLWKERYTMAELEKIKGVYKDSPRGISGFYQEYFLQVQSDEDAIWTRHHIKEWEGYFTKELGYPAIVINGEIIPVKTFIGCDPATDIATALADYSVILILGVDSLNRRYVLEYIHEKSIPTTGLRDDDNELIGSMGVTDFLIEKYIEYDCESACVEDVAMTRSVFQDLEKQMMKPEYRTCDFSFIPEKPLGREKLNKIKTGLNPRFNMGLVYVKGSMAELINEILTFGPKMSYDDIIESFYFADKYAYPEDGITEAKEVELEKPKSWRNQVNQLSKNAAPVPRDWRLL